MKLRKNICEDCCKGKRISELDEKVDIQGTEYIPFQERGDNGKFSLGSLKDYLFKLIEEYLINNGIIRKDWVQSEPAYKLLATLPELIADRACKDEFGNNINDTYLTRQAVKEYIGSIYEDLFVNNPPQILDGFITVDMLSDAVLQLLNSGGAITNFPDDEDITVKDSKLKFKDKVYDPNNYSGIGRTILRKNMVDGVNVLTQEMISEPNQIYIIQYDYDLRGKTITIPDNSILWYLGGSLNNGTITSNSEDPIVVWGQMLGNINIDIDVVLLDVPADEEDITSKTGELKFADKSYDVANFSGLGRKYLRKHIIDNKNILTQDMINSSNTIYIIQYNYDLNEETITIPEGCVLKFEGGRFYNGSINGINTSIKGDVGIFSSIEFKGTYLVSRSYTEWFDSNMSLSDIINQSLNISDYVVLSRSGSYDEDIIISKDFTLDLSGHTLEVSSIIIESGVNKAIIDLNNGTLKGKLHGGLVKETVTGGTKFTAVEGHNFIVGQILHSSKEYEFFGTANYPLSTPVTVTNVIGNDVYISKDLGDTTLTAGMGLGNFTWTSLISNGAKTLLVKNGVISDSPAYYCSTRAGEGNVTLENINFGNAGLDQFKLEVYDTLTIKNCYISKPLDYAKTTIMVFQGSVIVEDTVSDGGNFDYFVGCWQGDYEGDDTVNKGRIYINNCILNGAKIDTDESIGNALHCIEWRKNGTLDSIIIKDTVFKNYQRAIVSSSSIPVQYNIHVKNLSITGCQVDSPLLKFVADTVKFDNILIDSCLVKDITSGELLIQIFGDRENSYDKVSINNSVFRNMEMPSYRTFSTLSMVNLNNCSFYSSKMRMYTGGAYFTNCYLSSDSAIGYQPANILTPITYLGNFVVEEDALANITNMFPIYEGNNMYEKLAEVKVANGTHIYDVVSGLIGAELVPKNIYISPTGLMGESAKTDTIINYGTLVNFFQNFGNYPESKARLGYISRNWTGAVDGDYQKGSTEIKLSYIGHNTFYPSEGDLIVIETEENFNYSGMITENVLNQSTMTVKVNPSLPSIKSGARFFIARAVPFNIDYGIPNDRPILSSYGKDIGFQYNNLDSKRREYWEDNTWCNSDGTLTSKVTII